MPNHPQQGSDLLKYRDISTSAATEIDSHLELDILIFYNIGIEDHVSTPCALSSDLKK